MLSNKEWREFYQRFMDMIFDHQNHKGEVGTLARSLIKQIESFWLFLDITETGLIVAKKSASQFAGSALWNRFTCSV